MITHKGGHDSGHYECFRRQIVHRPPYSTPTLKSAISDLATLDASPTLAEGPTIRLVDLQESALSISPMTASSNASSNASNSDAKSTPPSSISANANRPPSPAPDEAADSAQQKPIDKIWKKHGNNKWWRISDDKIKETKTLDVLGMQKEVYLLFYEKERPE